MVSVAGSRHRRHAAGRHAAAAGQGVPAMRRAASSPCCRPGRAWRWSRMPTQWPCASTPQGFIVAGASDSRRHGRTWREQLAHAAGLTRRFDFPSQPTETLLRQLQRQVTEDARRRTARPRTAPPGSGAHDDRARIWARRRMPAAAGREPMIRARPLPGAMRRWRRSPHCWRIGPRTRQAWPIRALPATDDIALWRAVRLAQLRRRIAAAAARRSPQPCRCCSPTRRNCATAAAAGGRDAGDRWRDRRRGRPARRPQGRQDARPGTRDAAGGEGRQRRSAGRLRQAGAVTRPVGARPGRGACRGGRLATGAIDAKQAADRLEKPAVLLARRPPGARAARSGWPN